MEHAHAFIKTILFAVVLCIVFACGGGGGAGVFPLTTTTSLIGINNSLNNVNMIFQGEALGPANVVPIASQTERPSPTTKTWNSGASIQTFTIEVWLSGTKKATVNFNMTGDERDSGKRLQATWDGTTLSVTHV